jgi:hypothetical protein
MTLICRNKLYIYLKPNASFSLVTWRPSISCLEDSVPDGLEDSTMTQIKNQHIYCSYSTVLDHQACWRWLCIYFI